ncbi:hypothetical protein [Pseudonocardia broussonetiae]|uniref:Uncharacterized protein n=1 Tax=Pseudonocardia broussonetiae TaxID=2736640 RepID=A0A6M6JIV5_9PSEU|nr:hypothetical protein [Pseudonocardia broussonetiae]QJY46940.1 hypothetical protein HOP40_14870 [Pseudonocardia broussonetiae]
MAPPIYTDDEPSPDQSVIYRRFGMHAEVADTHHRAGLASPRTRSRYSQILEGIALKWREPATVHHRSGDVVEWFSGPDAVAADGWPRLQIGHERDAPVIGECVSFNRRAYDLHVRWRLDEDVLDELGEWLRKPHRLSIGFEELVPPDAVGMSFDGLPQVRQRLVAVDHCAIVVKGAYPGARTLPLPLAD